MLLIVLLKWFFKCYLRKNVLNLNYVKYMIFFFFKKGEKRIIIKKIEVIDKKNCICWIKYFFIKLIMLWFLNKNWNVIYYWVLNVNNYCLSSKLGG